MEPCTILKENNYFVTQDFEKYDLDEFMSKCKKLGFKNNSSLKEMRWDWVYENMGSFWAFVKDDNIISISGCHPFPGMEDDPYRIGYRSAVIPGEDPFKGISKYGYNAIPNRVLFQYQIRFCQNIGVNNFILTTNCDKDGYLDMSHVMEQKINKYTNLSEYLGDRIIFGTKQSLWKYNVEEYKKSILRLKQEKYFIIDQI